MKYKKIKLEDNMTECYFTQGKNTSSATICKNCGLEKMLHTIGERIKVNKVIILNYERGNIKQ